MTERYHPPAREELEAQLAKSRARLADLEERGNDACSAYDLRMGYDAAFNKQLARNHISYFERQLAPYASEPQQADFFAALDVRTSPPSTEESGS